MLEAARLIGQSFEKLCYFESGCRIKPKDFEAGICIGDQECECPGQRRHSYQGRAEGLLCRDWEAAREAHSARNECKLGCCDEPNRW